MSVSLYLSIHSVLVAQKSNKSLSIPIKLSSEKNVKIIDKVHTLMDTRVGGIIDQNYAKKQGYPLKTLPKPLTVFNVDGTPNKKGMVKKSTEL